ncbi:MAG TPA: thioesterase family protein [Thermomicrobiaceae bacterium]|nr:thioesterase family protein [Thermomicrobiaceae bacterium]
MLSIPTGATASFAFAVSDDMTVDFEELGKGHPVYATYWMAKHFELVGRKLLVPHLGPGEEAIGYGVSVRHLRPAVPGTRLRVTGVLDRVEGNRVYTNCSVDDQWGDRIGEGETIQVVLPEVDIIARFARQRDRLAEQPERAAHREEQS